MGPDQGKHLRGFSKTGAGLAGFSARGHLRSVRVEMPPGLDNVDIAIDHMCDIGGVLNTPYTRWLGDGLHGRTRAVTPVWVHLDALTMRANDTVRQMVPDGLDMTGRAKGRLTGWLRSVEGDWFGIVDDELSYADGRREQVPLRDQLVPRAALSPRTEN